MYMVVIGFPTFVEPNSQLPGEEQVWLLRLRGGQGEYRLTAIANPHGRWIELRPGSPWKPWTRERLKRRAASLSAWRFRLLAFASTLDLP